MRNHPLEPKDYASSVVAVPPLALFHDLQINAEANRAMIRHIEAGGVRILLYGGNANLYHIDLGRFRELLAILVDAAGPDTAMVPSIGPGFGKMLDQAPLVRESGIRDVMILPTAFPADAAGIDRGVRLVVEALGFGVVLYIKRDGYVEPSRLEKLVADGVVRFVKYAVEREDPFEDPYLADLISAIGNQRVASGMGETPLHAHFPRYQVATFTSGGVCIAPAAAMALLAAYKAGDTARAEQISAPFVRFEKVRSRLGGISVLHDGVSMSGIADMGPILPLLSNVADAHRAAVQEVVEGLQAIERRVNEST
jgi:dihydrodipicolinate synthase/N-acetylneuraminate lyase